MLYTLHAHIERKQLLVAPSEQSRLLDEFPEVIADEIEVEPTDKQYSRKDLLPESDSREFSKPSTKDTRGDRVFPCVNDVAGFAEHERQCKRPKSAGLEQQHHTISSDKSNDDDPEASCSQLVSGNHIDPQAQPNSVLPERLKEKQSEPGSESIEIYNDEQKLKKKQNGPRPDLIEICDDDEQDNSVKVREEIIELSDDEEQDDTIGPSKKIVEDDPNSLSWYYMSPSCIKAGPHSMSELIEWNDAFPNESTMKVWKTNQSRKEAISLADAVRQFSCEK